MKYTGAVFFDNDGTLTDDLQGIKIPTKATVDAIHRLGERGYLTALCTGRTITYAGHVAKFFDASISSNGTYAVVGDEVVFDCPMNPDDVEKITDYMDSEGILYMLDNPHGCYISDINSKLFSDWCKMYNIPGDVYTGDSDKRPKQVYKIGMLCNTQGQLDMSIKLFGKMFDIDPYQGTLFSDVSTPGIGKGSGVQAVIEYFGIDRENTYAFGDGTNDISMFKIVGHGIAMGVHGKRLEEYAEFITKNVEDDGIAFGLKYYGLTD